MEQAIKMRKINEIIVHCSATKPQTDIGVKEIRNMHVQDNKWADIGYHYVIRLNGYIEKGRSVYRAGAHCYGHNRHSIGVCYVGGLDQSGNATDTRTPAQKKALRKLLEELVSMYHCPIFGHRDFAAKDCPCFDARTEYADIYKQYV